MKQRTTMVGLAALGLGGLFAACGGGSEGTTPGSSGAGGNGGTASNGAGTNSGGVGGDPFGNAGPGVGAGAGSGGVGGDASCAGERSTAQLVPLDLYIMLDASGSMNEETTAGVTKWDAVTDALSTFFTDPQSAGLGVGLQYFPLRDPDVPDSCTNSSQCGASGPCVLRVCTGTSSITPCNTNADCGFGRSCVDLGACANTGGLCAPAGGTCSGGDGRCNRLTTSTCFQQDSCDAADYAAPDVGIAPLAAASSAALVASIGAKQPEGATPTQGALAGAIQQAQTYAAANPDHKVVAVLATDGLPTECDVQTADGIAAIAAAGVSGSPSVSTFVIGVFALGDMSARATMNAIASAGGTDSAFIVDATSNTSQAFLDALTAIRGQSLACDYLVPTPTGGQTIDYGEVNVEHTPPNATDANTIFYVTNEAGCDPATGGWYYDIEPTGSQAPTKLVMCPSTCTLFQQGGQVDISVGCKTEIPPPR
jgi:hypothetical protein